MDRRVGLGLGLEGATLLHERLQLFAQVGECLPVEAGAGVSDVNQVVAFVDAQQQGAEVLAIAALLREAANDGLLAQVRLELEPGAAALPGEIAAFGQLGDHAFEILPGQGREE